MGLSFKPSTRSTRKHKSIRGYRKPDFISADRAMIFFQHRVHHIAQYRRLQSGCVRIDQEKQRFIGQQLSTQLYQRINCILNLPDFSFRASAVRWRIHNNCIIVISTTDLTFYKLYTVVHDPADRSVLETGGDSVFFCPCHHTFEASTCVTEAPAAAAARVAPPV